MSLSKYTTPEATNIGRLAAILLDPCTKTLREILKREVSPSDLSKEVQDFIDDAVKHRKKFKRLDFKQENIIFPPPTLKYRGDYTDLDISLLYYLLRNICKKISPPSKGWGNIPDPKDKSIAANIERIRMTRNECYGHTADLSLSEADFNRNCQILRDAVVELEKYLGTTIFQDDVNEIEMCSMDPKETKKKIDLLGNLVDLQKSLDDFLDPKVSRKIDEPIGEKICSIMYELIRGSEVNA
ncbi:uncharacterized protein LOC134233015 [Saccostrea cucullata]|uniref:uncharacterized protein LOC134233015 n=1 Tax=Saccostrea cuccullata TaxID=36930 RepID=UPI002ED22EF7